MANSQSFFFLLILAILIFVSLPSLVQSNPIHEILRVNGLPAGLFPKQVKSFNLDDLGRLEVFLFGPCLTKFENRVYFDSVVKGNLSYGELRGLEGLAQEELFLWLPVKDIMVPDPSSGLILFDVGVIHKQFSFSLFENPPDCTPEGKPIPSVDEGSLRLPSGNSRKKEKKVAFEI